MYRADLDLMTISLLLHAVLKDMYMSGCTCPNIFLYVFLTFGVVADIMIRAN